jgi:hypothetical protein
MKVGQVTDRPLIVYAQHGRRSLQACRQDGHIDVLAAEIRPRRGCRQGRLVPRSQRAASRHSAAPTGRGSAAAGGGRRRRLGLPQRQLLRAYANADRAKQQPDGRHQ